MCIWNMTMRRKKNIFYEICNDIIDMIWERVKTVMKRNYWHWWPYEGGNCDSIDPTLNYEIWRKWYWRNCVIYSIWTMINVNEEQYGVWRDVKNNWLVPVIIWCQQLWFLNGANLMVNYWLKVWLCEGRYDIIDTVYWWLVLIQ